MYDSVFYLHVDLLPLNHSLSPTSQEERNQEEEQTESHPCLKEVGQKPDLTRQPRKARGWLAHRRDDSKDTESITVKRLPWKTMGALAVTQEENRIRQKK